MTTANTDYERLAKDVEGVLRLAGFDSHSAETLAELPGFEVDIDDDGVLVNWRTEQGLRDAALAVHLVGDSQDPNRRIYEVTVREMCDLAIRILVSAGFHAAPEGGYAPFHVRVTEGSANELTRALFNEGLS
ncbi:hypothetical protein AB0F72_19600 [Actinoplanes sp. NPDC023936]|uniref:hypothetical protein n=1 Tax=Actinoplanes sp. NPDC023936 TaxID=3154910 RepID=UPI0033C648F3